LIYFRYIKKEQLVFVLFLKKTIMKKRHNAIFVLLILIMLIGITRMAKSDVCSDSLIYDGFEDVVKIGMDTTGHHWIITRPTKGYFRIIIDGQASNQFQAFKNFKFSPDGNRWACFAKDNVTWNIMTNDTIYELYCDEVLNLGFSPNSQVLYYAYKIGSQVYYQIGDKNIRGIGGTGDIYVSWGAERYAIGERRGGKMTYKLQGWETPPYDEIKPVGFWNDGSFIYIVKLGNFWEIYKDKESISESYINVSEYAINLTGTAAGFLARRTRSNAVGILLSDDYYEPLITKSYEYVSGLALHPHIDLMAFKAIYNNSEFIVLSNTEYAGGQENGNPHWTHDGSQLYFSGCATDCFINIDGRRYNLNQMFDRMEDFVVKPNSNTIAYSTSTTLVVRDLISGTLYSGMMVDYMTNPIFSWRDNAYLALGVINRRVFLMKCSI